MSDTVHVLRDNGSGKYPVAPKVNWAAAGAGLMAVVGTWVMSALGDPQLVTGVPDWVVVIVSGLVTGGVTFGAGYKAPHQSRDDLPRADGGMTASGGKVG